MKLGRGFDRNITETVKLQLQYKFMIMNVFGIHQWF